MRAKRELSLLAVAAVAAGALGAWWAWPRATQPAADDGAGNPVRGGTELAEVLVEDASGPPARPVSGGSPSPGLDAPSSPPLRPAEADSPLRDTLADLERRALAGDGAAACRVGAELLRCERARNMQPYVDNIEAQTRHHARPGARPEELDRGIDQALQRQAENAAVLSHCEGVDPAAHAPAARWFGIAAQSGHRPSMVRFLGAELYRPDQLFRDPGLIGLYRARAPVYFTQLLEAGDVEFLQRWAMAAGMPNDILFDVLPPPYNERGLGTAMMGRYLRARGIKPPDVMRPFPATEEQGRRAGELFDRHFGHMAAPEQLPQRLAPSTYDLAQYRCEDAGS